MSNVTMNNRNITKDGNGDLIKFENKSSSVKEETKVILSVDDVIEQIAKIRRNLVQKRELSQKDEFKVVVTFSEIEKQLKSHKPKRKKIEKNFNILLKLFSTVKLSNTREVIENLTYLKDGVSNLVTILCL